MNLLDLYENREPYQQAIDKLEQRRIADLEARMDDCARRGDKEGFRKAKEERDSYHKVKEGAEDFANIYSPEAIALGKKFCEQYNITNRDDVQMAVEIIDLELQALKHEGRPVDLKQIRKSVADAFRYVHRGMGSHGFNFRKKFQGEGTNEAGIPGNLPPEQVPGKEDLLKGRGRQTYEGAYGPDGSRALSNAHMKLIIDALGKPGVPGVTFEFDAGKYFIDRHGLDQMADYYEGIDNTQKSNFAKALGSANTLLKLAKDIGVKVTQAPETPIQPPVEPKQLDLLEKKKNKLKTPGDPEADLAIKLARTRHPSAKSDLAALVKDKIATDKTTQKELDQLKADNERQEKEIKDLEKQTQALNIATSAEKPKSKQAKSVSTTTTKLPTTPAVDKPTAQPSVVPTYIPVSGAPKEPAKEPAKDKELAQLPSRRRDRETLALPQPTPGEWDIFPSLRAQDEIPTSLRTAAQSATDADFRDIDSAPSLRLEPEPEYKPEPKINYRPARKKSKASFNAPVSKSKKNKASRRATAESQMSNLDIEFQDWKNRRDISDAQFEKMYGLTRPEWFNKHRSLIPAQNEGWSDAVVARRTGRPRTPYSVYIKGRKWKDFENEDHAEAVANKLRAKFKAEGRDPSVITIAPTDYDKPINEFEVADLVRPNQQAQTNTPPRRAYSIALQGKPGKPGGNLYQAEDAWAALRRVFPKEYPNYDAAAEKVQEVLQRGSAIVKTGINSEDIADSYVAKLSSFVPAQHWKIIGGELEEAQQWQGNLGAQQAQTTDHTMDEAIQYVKTNYPFNKKFRITRAEPGFRADLDPGQYNRSNAQVNDVDSAMDYLQLRENPVMSGSRQISASLGYSWHTNENPSTGIAVFYYEDRGMGWDEVIIAGKTKEKLAQAVQVFRDAGIIPTPKAKVAESETIKYGDMVQHPQFGQGRVAKVWPDGMISVNFPKYPDPIDKKPGVQVNMRPGEANYQKLNKAVKEHGGGGSGPREWHSYVRSHRANEAANPAQQAAIAIAMKKAGKKPKHVDEAEDRIDPIILRALERLQPGLEGSQLYSAAKEALALEFGLMKARGDSTFVHYLNWLQDLYNNRQGIAEHGGGVNSMKQYIAWRKSANKERGITKKQPVGKMAPQGRAVPKGTVHGKLDQSRGVIPTSSFHEDEMAEAGTAGLEDTIRRLMAPAYEEETGGMFSYTLEKKAPTMARLRKEYSDDLNDIFYNATPEELHQAAQELKDMYGQVAEGQTDYQKRRQRERDIDAGRPVAKQRQPKQTDYQKRRAQDKKDMELGEGDTVRLGAVQPGTPGYDAWYKSTHKTAKPDVKTLTPQTAKSTVAGAGKQNLMPKVVDEDQDTSAVESAIIRRIMVAHKDWLVKFGPQKVMQAAEEVAYNVGDVDEIGTSDVSAYVHEVGQILGVGQLDEKWSAKYKRSIDCSHPKGFSQRAHCAGRKK